MYHFESISLQLNYENERNRKSYELTSEPKRTWIAQQTSISNWTISVDPDFIKDSFNLYELEHVCPDFSGTIQIITSELNENTQEYSEEQQQNAIKLYKYIHQRFAVSPQGLQIIKRKYESGIYGQCPRFMCEGQNLLPMGESSTPNISNVCAYCPKCMDCYKVDVDLDGAYFGPSFPAIFQQSMRDFMKFRHGPKTNFQYLGIPIEENAPIRPRIVWHSPEESPLI